MNFTLFGYPQTGKTTLFNLLTGAGLELHDFATGKKDLHSRTCPVPDERLDAIAALYPEKTKKPAAVDFIDLAGLSFGDIRNEAYLGHLRKADGLTHVVRGFKAPQIPAPRGRVDPAGDIKAIEQELVLADLISVEVRLDKLDKDLKKGRTPEGEKERELLLGIKKSLDGGTALREIALSPAEDKLLRSFAFLSLKPLFHMINIDEEDTDLIGDPDKICAPERPKTCALAFCGKIESEILELDESEKLTFLKEYGLHDLTAPRFLHASYELLDVITFFTIGKEEVKAWTIPRDTQARQAAGAIHTDIEQGFIRAEVIPWNSLIDCGSLNEARQQARVRLEGKDYVVQDGDVIYFRFAK